MTARLRLVEDTPRAAVSACAPRQAAHARAAASRPPHRRPGRLTVDYATITIGVVLVVVNVIAWFIGWLNVIAWIGGTP